MVKSLFVTASAGSGKTYRLTEEVRRHIENDKSFVIAATFTRAAAAEMEERILARIDKEKMSAALKLRLIMQAAKVHYSTIDSLFHQFLSTESYEPQVADDHEKELIVKTVDGRFFQHPQVVADTQNILIAARILRLPPEKLLDELDESQESLATWECPDALLDDLMQRQTRLVDRYEKLQKRVRAVEEETRGALRSQVVNPLLEPLSDVDLTRALFRKADLTEVKVAAAERRTPAFAELRELYPEMRRLVAEHLINTKRLRSAVLKRFSALRTCLIEEEKKNLGRLDFADIPKALIDLDGPDSADRPFYMARLYELGFHKTTHLLLDEFQDTSKIQYDLIQPLIDEILSGVGEDAQGERSLFLVGDWKQSIYQWRGAAPEDLKECVHPLIESGQIATETLPYNFRSTPLLIGFFNHLVGELFPEQARAHNQAPPPPDKRKEPYSGPSEVETIPVPCGAAGDGPAYERLVEEIEKKKAKYGCAWGNIAVLCRTNAQMDRIAKELVAHGISTSGIRGRELLSIPEGTALFLSLVAVFSEHDGRFIPGAFSRLGCKEGLANAIAGLAGAVDAMPRPRRFAALASVLRDLLPYFPRILIETLWDEGERYFDRPEARDDADSAEVSDFLGYLLRMLRLITVPEGEHAERVKIATIHSAKGLQFPHVLLFWKESPDRTPEGKHPDDGCPLTLNRSEVEFLATGPIAGAEEIANDVKNEREKRTEQTTNLLYVAATRAVKSLTILLRADKEGHLKGFGERMHRAAKEKIEDAEPTASGWRCDYGPGTPRPPDYEVLEKAPCFGERLMDRADGDEMDPTLLSTDIEAGIDRGLRIHGTLARLTGRCDAMVSGNLGQEESDAVKRFLRDEKVREIIFRPGIVRTEQHLSDTRSFGIVDRLIIAPDRITLIDFKTGRVGHLVDKYRSQMLRYRTILQGLYGNRPVEGYLLFVDEPQRILTV